MKKRWNSKNHQECIALTKMHQDLIAKLPLDLRNYAAIVGGWVWVWWPRSRNGEMTLKYGVLLKSLGFHWNSRRDAWQNPCGIESQKSIHDPRRYYLVQEIGKRPIDYIPKQYTTEDQAENACPF